MIYMNMYVHTCALTYVCVPVVSRGQPPQEPFTLLGFSLPWSSLICVGWMARVPRNPPPQHWDHKHVSRHPVFFFTWVLGLELRSLYLQGQCFAN